MPDCKTGVSHSNNDIQDERKNSTRKICGEDSKGSFGRQKSSTIKGNQGNETNGKLEIVDLTLVDNGDASDEQFPEHNGKFANRLRTSKRSSLALNNMALPKHRPLSGMKPQKNEMFVSSLEEVSNASFDHLNSEACEEKLPSLDELEEFIANQGETLGPGWKVQISRNNTYFLSPDKKRFASMMSVAKHLKKKKEKIQRAKKRSQIKKNQMVVCPVLLFV